MPSELEDLIFTYFWAENRVLGRLRAILDASWCQHGSMLGPNMAPCWGPRRAQDPQEKKTMSRRSRETHPRRGTPSVLLGKARWGTPPGLGFWSIFGSMLLPSCSYVGAFGSTWLPKFHLKLDGGLAALRRFGSAAPGLVPAHGV